MSSSISAARLALYNLLAATTWPANTDLTDEVQVTFGLPSGYEAREVVALMGVESTDEAPAALGRLQQEESYRLVVGIKVHDPGAATAQTVDVRCWALYETARRALLDSADLTLGGTVRTALPAGSPETDGVQSAEGGGYVMFVRMFVECRQRIA